MKNEQIVLDRVLAHLKAQGWERSMMAGSCRNRDDRGRKCAVACLLDNDELTECDEVLVATAFKAGAKFGVDQGFIDAVRRCHDSGDTPTAMKHNFVWLAARYELDASGVVVE